MLRVLIKFELLWMLSNNGYEKKNSGNTKIKQKKNMYFLKIKSIFQKKYFGFNRSHYLQARAAR